VAQDFLVKREKIYCSIAVFHRMNVLNPPPTGISNYIILAPLRKTEFQPGAVLFICNADNKPAGWSRWKATKPDLLSKSKCPVRRVTKQSPTLSSTEN
jgi:hypothetical protein